MMHKFRVGDSVGWKIEFGDASGTIIKVHTHDTNFKGLMRRCSEADPQYEIRSSRTDHIAMHKGAALRMLE